MSPILDSIGSTKGYGWGSLQFLNGFNSIATITLSAGGSSSINFNAIPQGYEHLQIRGNVRSNRGDGALEGFNLRFNGNTTNNYSYHRLSTDGTTIISNGEGSNNSIASVGIPTATSDSTLFSSIIIDILDYKSSSKYKTVRIISGNDRNGAGSVGITSGSFYVNTNAITSLSFYGSTGQNLSENSTLALYGVK